MGVSVPVHRDFGDQLFSLIKSISINKETKF
jgi:hypothetical protein